MDHAPTSSEIISECLKRYGEGQLFFRRDGLEFEAQRVRQRQDYLESHPEIDEQHRHAIAQAAVTPGMTREEVVAAWGLLSADTRMSFGHVKDDRRAAYAVFTGFAVGAAIDSHLVIIERDFIKWIR